jgi:N-acetylmuramoyl-L-alanine amidase
VSALLLSLVASFQLATAVPAPSIGLRNASISRRVPVVRMPAGLLFAADELATLLPIRTVRSAPGQYRLVISGVTLDIELGSVTVRVGREIRQLALAPLEREGRLLLPLQFVSEVLPAVVPNVRWDSAARQLVVFSKVVSPQARPPSQGATSPATPVAPPRVVVVDAGHGGPDNGMTGPIGAPVTLYEKDVTLAIAKKLGRELRERGLKVVFTRTTDTLIALSDRGRIANQAGGDLFISIHVNAANLGWRDPAASRGFETYFLAEAKTEDARRVERMENEAVRFETNADVAKSDALGFILSDMKQNEHLRESSELAELIQGRLAGMHPGPNRGVKQAGFRVLVTAFMPSVLVEIGFGTNRNEAAYLNDGRNQSAIARAIADAAVEYLRRYERRVGAGSGR